MTLLSQQLGSLPIVVIFNEGKVGFQRIGNFPLIIDQPEQGVQALVTIDDIYIGSGTQIEYNEWYDIDDTPELKSYLVALKVITTDIE